MLAAIIVVAVAFTILTPFGGEGILAASLVSIGVGGLCLVVGRFNLAVLIQALAYGVAGMFLGSFFRPIGAYDSIWHQGHGAFFGVAIFVFIGSLIRERRRFFQQTNQLQQNQNP